MQHRGKEKSTRQVKAGKDTSESPYLAARREWNERYGSYIARANHWRLVALGSTAVALIAVAGLVVVSMQHKVVPFLVETNVHGEPWKVHPAAQMQTPNEHQVRAALRQWLLGARTVYVDLRAQQAVVDNTYAMTLPGSAAYQRLAQFHSENNPYRRARDRDEVVEVTVNLVSPLSGESWLIEWNESVRQRSGTLLTSRDWQATVMVALTPAKTPEQLKANPLGLYVHQLSWNPRL